MDGSLERKRSGSKFLRKKLTDDGKVRYIYKESEPRGKKAEEVPQDKKQRFIQTIDSTDRGFKNLFSEACDEIDDIHYVCINSGCSSVQMTNDVETFFDVLDVLPEYQEKDVFRSASGCFNVNKGKIAFCLDNFPQDMSETIKQVVMLHETMHSFFYGALRLKHKQPLTADSSDDKMDKDYIKKAVKFVDSFGKIDQNMRKTAEGSVKEVKGQDKETLLLNQISAAMISEYAAISPEEHFAEAGAFYFILPNVLKTKEAEVYKAFNEFFEKYED
jgi:hypothetical protein